MSVVVGIVVPDGIVMAADSRTTYKLPHRQRIATYYSHKLFEIAGCAVGAAGWNQLNGRTVAAQLRRFKPSAANLSPEDAAKEIHAYLAALYDEHIQKFSNQAVADDSPAITFMVGGYTAAHEPALHFGNVPKLVVEAPDMQGKTTPMDLTINQQLPNPMNVIERYGTRSIGNSSVIYRLLRGYDLEAVPMALWSQLGPCTPIIPYDVFGIQDGVDLANFSVASTIRMQRFAWGTVGKPDSDGNTVGGAIDIAVVTEDGFTWAKRKELHTEAQFVEQL